MIKAVCVPVFFLVGYPSFRFFLAKLKMFPLLSQKIKGGKKIPPMNPEQPNFFQFDIFAFFSGIKSTNLSLHININYSTEIAQYKCRYI